MKHPHTQQIELLMIRDHLEQAIAIAKCGEHEVTDEIKDAIDACTDQIKRCDDELKELAEKERALKAKVKLGRKAPPYDRRGVTRFLRVS